LNSKIMFLYCHLSALSLGISFFHGIRLDF